MSKLVKKSKNPKKSRKISKIHFFSNWLFLEFFLGQKKNHSFSFPILGGRDLTRALQSSPFQKYENLEKSQKITFFSDFFFNFLFAEGNKLIKCYSPSFPILGGRDSTRALQSVSMQNPGWVPRV